MGNLLTTTSWKTTLSGVLNILVIILAVLFPKTFTEVVTAGLLAVFTSFGLISAKDSTITGIGSTATTIEKDVVPLVNDLTATSTNPIIQDIHKIVSSIASNQNIVPTASTVVNVTTPQPAVPSQTPTVDVLDSEGVKVGTSS